MKVRTSLGIMLIVVLLAQTTQSFKWQAMGSEMNNTVISEIWYRLETNLQSALNVGSGSNFVKDISDRLNARWSQAWNVVLVVGRATFDSVLYGYAFRNQWMWYNGVPYANKDYMPALIVWKDYNCQDWKDTIMPEFEQVSSFSTAKKAAIRAEINKMTETGITNDIWGTAFTMMKNLEAQADFSSGGYSVIMSQYGGGPIYGRICRVGDGFYNSYKELGYNGIIAPDKGQFYLFQTR